MGRDLWGFYGYMERNIVVKYWFNNVWCLVFCKIFKLVWKSCLKCLIEMFERKNVLIDRSLIVGLGLIFDFLLVFRVVNFVFDLLWSLIY